MTELATIGSSDVAAILGLSPWASPWDAWCRLTGLVPRYSEAATAAQARGHWMERALGEHYAAEAGIAIWPGPAIGEPPLPGPEAWMHDRPDFLALDRAIEIKTTRRFDAAWGDPELGQAPAYYLAQCVWHAVCTGLERVDLVAYATIDEAQRVYVLAPTARQRDRLVARVAAWRERHLVGGEPPPIDGSAGCAKALAIQYATPRAEYALARWDDEQALAFRAACVATIEHTERLKAQVENALKARIGDAAGLADDTGRRLVSWSPAKGRTGIDVERLRAERPEIAREYETTGAPSRRFVVHNNKEKP